MNLPLVGHRVQVRGRWRRGLGAILYVTPKTLLVELDEDPGVARRFARKSCRPVRYRKGARLPWDDTPAFSE